MSAELQNGFFILLPPFKDISREFPRALDVGAHAGHIYRAICEKVPRVGRYAVKNLGGHRERAAKTLPPVTYICCMCYAVERPL